MAYRLFKIQIVYQIFHIILSYSLKPFRSNVNQKGSKFFLLISETPQRNSETILALKINKKDILSLMCTPNSGQYHASF